MLRVAWLVWVRSEKKVAVEFEMVFVWTILHGAVSFSSSLRGSKMSSAENLKPEKCGLLAGVYEKRHSKFVKTFQPRLRITTTIIKYHTHPNQISEIFQKMSNIHVHSLSSFHSSPIGVSESKTLASPDRLQCISVGQQQKHVLPGMAADAVGWEFYIYDISMASHWFPEKGTIEYTCFFSKPYNANTCFLGGRSNSLGLNI